jgi:hypothetical protein
MERIRLGRTEMGGVPGEGGRKEYNQEVNYAE